MPELGEFAKEPADVPVPRCGPEVVADEELDAIVGGAEHKAGEPRGAMGDDTPLVVDEPFTPVAQRPPPLVAEGGEDQRGGPQGSVACAACGEKVPEPVDARWQRIGKTVRRQPVELGEEKPGHVASRHEPVDPRTVGVQDCRGDALIMVDDVSAPGRIRFGGN
ncbi:hypothetical protein O1L44_19760 [Streptomyces noursei]|nr:hypothetical protein [Streptomyces noursei]